MFTGIVEVVGIIKQKKVQSDTVDFFISVPAFFYPLSIGESISMNGVCLTVTHLDIDGQTIQVTAVPETLRLTNLGFLKEQSLVNLERSLTLQSRLGGHIAQGHVDGVGEIIQLEADGARALNMTVRIPKILSKYIIQKGYIAVDGMSLTITDVGDDYFSVTLIPHTQEVTVLSRYQCGSKVNVEVDMVGKYIEKLVGATS